MTAALRHDHRDRGLAVLGGAVLLEGEALRSAAHLLAWAHRDHRQRGHTPPPLTGELIAATQAALTEQGIRHRDVASNGAGVEWITTREVADRLGIGVRQAQRLATTLDAQHHKGRLRYPAGTVDEYRLIRRPA